MSIRKELDDLRAKVLAVSDLSVERFLESHWTFAEWCHRLAKLPVADARRFASGLIEIDPNESDEDFMRFLAECPADYWPDVAAGAVPQHPDHPQ